MAQLALTAQQTFVQWESQLHVVGEILAGHAQKALVAVGFGLDAGLGPCAEG